MWHIFSVDQIPKISTKNIPTTVADQGRIDETLTIVFGILGTIAVLMMVMGGIKYIIAKGNPGDLAKAKDTILYAAIGLGICIMAYSIVLFVLSNI